MTIEIYLMHLPHHLPLSEALMNCQNAMTTAHRQLCMRPNSSSLQLHHHGMKFHRATYTHILLEQHTTQPKHGILVRQRLYLQPEFLIIN